MTSYLIQIKQCPECGCQFKVWAIASCNTIDARFYTDGSVEGSMYEEGSALLTCRNAIDIFGRRMCPPEKRFLTGSTPMTPR
jgi:hypothetical protein